MVSKSVKMLARGVNLAIEPLGARIVGMHDWTNPEQYISFQDTISSAKKAGLSVSDYIDVTYNVAGATQETIDRMVAAGIFSDRVATVAEIGPGSGRYLERVLRICSPTRYEFYETAASWANYLVHAHDAVWQPTNGRSMAPTKTGSIDLVHAHKVFVVTPFLTTCAYWLEMIRVARQRAHIVFDVVTEACMDQATLECWLERGTDHGSYPAIMPRAFMIDFFKARGVQFVDSFSIPMKPGRTETFVFRKG
jgi:hypothetical protein